MTYQPKNEAEFRRDVVRLARKGVWSVHTDPDLRQRMGSPGFPDLVLARGNDPQFPSVSKVLYRELKMVGNYLSPEQDRWRRLLEAAGANYAIWRPTDWAMIEEELA